MSDLTNDIDMGQSTSGNHRQLTDVFYARPSELSPEKNLLVALMESAILDVDRDWINREGDDYVLSFARVCEELGINPQAARVALNKQLEGRKKRKKWRKIQVKDFMDEGFSHPYSHQLHCPECKTRYQRGYAKTVTASQRAYRRQRAKEAA